MTKILVCILALTISVHAQGQIDAHKEEAKRILERITGVKVKGSDPTLLQMIPLVADGRRGEAAQLATALPNFLNVTVKQFALQMSNREETFRVGLNDFAASVIGVTRDTMDARELLKGDFYYRANPAVVDPTKVRSEIGADLLRSNNHYADIERNYPDIAGVLMLVKGQVILKDAKDNSVVANPDPAGVLTSRAWMLAHANMGTNRRLVEFTLREFTCSPIEEWADSSAPDVRIGRDIDRFPGGDHNNFLTTCRSCHTVMDGFRGSFARWDFPNDAAIHATVSSGIAKDANNVSTKLNKNNTTYPGGYVTVNDSWVNHAVMPGNTKRFGWRAPAGVSMKDGTGVQGFGTLISNSQKFSQCMAQRVFKSVCQKELDGSTLAMVLVRLGNAFEQNGYKLKRLFELAVVDSQCK